MQAGVRTMTDEAQAAVDQGVQFEAQGRRRPISERFWKKVKKGGPDDCWIWTGCVNGGGYGQISAGGPRRMIPAHRVALLLDGTDVPLGKYVLHKCDNPPCVNPRHLFVGTNSDNMKDMVAKGRGPGLKAECRRGHPFKGDNIIPLENGWQRCRACRNAYQRDRRRRKNDRSI